jgi:hypothetical protein
MDDIDIIGFDGVYQVVMQVPVVHLFAKERGQVRPARERASGTPRRPCLVAGAHERPRHAAETERGTDVEEADISQVGVILEDLLIQNDGDVLASVSKLPGHFMDHGFSAGPRIRDDD